MEIKKDCFAYIERKNTCNALNDLYCKKENCKFYKKKGTVNISTIENTEY